MSAPSSSPPLPSSTDDAHKQPPTAAAAEVASLDDTEAVDTASTTAEPINDGSAAEDEVNHSTTNGTHVHENGTHEITDEQDEPVRVHNDEDDADETKEQEQQQPAEDQQQQAGPEEDGSPIGIMNHLYSQMSRARDPIPYLALFSPYFTWIFEFSLLTPEVTRVRYEEDESIQFFMKNVVPNLVRFVLTFESPSKAQAPVIQKFLHACILVAIRGVQIDVVELLFALSHLLGVPIVERVNGVVTAAPRGFYQTCGLPRNRGGDISWDEDHIPVPAEVQKIADAVVPPFPQVELPTFRSKAQPITQTNKQRTFVSSTGKRVFLSSYYLLRNVQFFGENGGYLILLERLQKGIEAARRKSMQNEQHQQQESKEEAPVSDSAIPSRSTSPAPSSYQYPPITIPHLIHLLTPIVETRFLVSNTGEHDFLLVFAQELRELVLTHFANIDDDDTLKQYNRKMLSRPLLQIELLLSASQPHISESEIRKIFELFELDWSWLYVCNKSLPLDRRINAINDIKDVIDCVEKKEEYIKKKGGISGSASSSASSMMGYVNAAVTSSFINLNVDASAPPPYTKIWMTNETLCQWLIQNQVLEELLEPTTTHIELVRRSYPVMRVLSVSSTPGSSSTSSSKGTPSHPLLTTQHIDLLWQLTCMGKHESIEHLIYDIVARLSLSLPVSLMNHIFKRMCEKTFASYDVIFLTLVRDFTVNTLKADSSVAQAASTSVSAARGAEQTYGIELLWSLLQSTHTHATKPGNQSSSTSSPTSHNMTLSLPSAEVLTRARTLLLELLQLDTAVNQRAKYMDRCIANIKSNILPSQSIQILLKLIEMYPIKSSGWFGSSSSSTRGGIIEGLEQKTDLLNLVINEMSTFHTKLQLINENDMTVALSPPTSPALQPLKILAEHLEIRLEFLVSILTHSSLTLSKSQVDLIWNSILASGTTARDTLYAFLIDACDAGDANILTDEVRSHLFHTKLLTLPPDTLSSMAFKLVLKYFLRVHYKDGSIKLTEEEKTNKKAPIVQSEFQRILSKHRGVIEKSPAKLSTSSASSSSSAIPFVKPTLVSSPSESSLPSSDNALISDEEQLAVNPPFETQLLSMTQKWCAHMSVQSYGEIHGIPFLWSIILRHTRARVARQSIILLNTIHQNLSSKMKSTTSEAATPTQIRDRYLRTCLTNMSQALAESAAAGTTNTAAANGRPGSISSMNEIASDLQCKKRISRCIYLLKTFLNGFSAQKMIPVAGSATEIPADSFILHILPNREYRVSAFDLVMKNTETIGDLRTKVFEYLSSRNPNTSIKSMSMVWNDKKLLSNQFVMNQIGFKHEDHIIVRRNSDLFTSYQPSSSVYTQPNASIFPGLFFDVIEEPWQDLRGRERYATISLMERTVVNEDATRSWARKSQSGDSTLASIASDPTSFDRLFTLLAPNSPISESVFDILMLLPTNLNSIRTFLNVQNFHPDKFQLLLDPKSMYRLLYSLQVLEEILTFKNAINYSSPSSSSSTRHPILQSLGSEYKSFDLGQWCQAFTSKGGVKYLAHLAQTCHIRANAPTLTSSNSFSSIPGASSKRNNQVPRAIQNEILQTLFTLLYTFFSFDRQFPSDVLTNSERPIRPQVQFVDGTWSLAKLPNFDIWMKQIVKDGIITAVMNTQPREGTLRPTDLEHQDDNTTSMILAAMKLLVACVHAVPSLIESVFYAQQAHTLDLLTVLLIKTPSSSARTLAAQAFFAIFKLSHKQSTATATSATSASSPSSSVALNQLFWSRTLLKLLQSPTIQHHQKQCSELFLLCIEYIDFLNSETMKPVYAEQLHSLDLFSTLFHLLREHQSIEKYDEYLEVDEFLVGILQLLRCVVTHRLAESSVEKTMAQDGSLLYLLAYVYHQCLFHTPAQDAIQGCKCKSHSSRVMAFGLLLEMATVYESCYAELICIVNGDPSWSIQRAPSQWGYDPTSLEKSSLDAPLGLKNQGATCYMNSFLQVLFNAKEFRRAIMTMRHNVEEATPNDHQEVVTLQNKSNGNDATPSHVSALHELQLLFGNLVWSQKSSFDTIDFCSTLKDYNGRPINIGEQKDVNEFASLLFDQLEQEMIQICKVQPNEEKQNGDDQSLVPVVTPSASVAASNALNKDIVEHTFRGTLVHEILSRDAECTHTTAREEAFYMISLTVVNKSSMASSLANFIEGDQLDNENKYMCSACNKKVAALKRCCFHDTKLPQYLILHLKRFEFNFDKMVKEKVNDYFEFPYKEGDYLNVEPYTQSGIARREAMEQGKKSADGANVEISIAAEPKPEGFYDYSLVGVLIHGGSAEGGHYITLCKREDETMESNLTSSTSPDASTSASSSSFYEFNDHNVRPFREDDIPATCFGGTELVEQYDKLANKTIKKEVTQIKNAYMCIYKRRWKPAPDTNNTNTGTPNQNLKPPHSPRSPSSAVETDEKDPKIEAVKTTNDKSLSTHASFLAVPNSSSAVTPRLTSSSSSPSLVTTGATSSSAAAPSPSSSPSAVCAPIWSYDRTRSDLRHFPPDILDRVWSDNLQFLSEKYLFDSNTNWFLWNLIQLHFPREAKVTQEQELNLATTTSQSSEPWSYSNMVKLSQISCSYVFHVLARSGDNATFPQWFELLYEIFDLAEDACRAFLISLFDQQGSATPFFHTMLFECPQQIVREAFTDLVVFVTARLRENEKERALYFDEVQPFDAEDASSSSSEFAPRSAIVHLLHWCLSFLPVVKRYHRMYKEYFRMFYHLARIGEEERRWLIEHGAVRALINFYLDSEPLVGFNVTSPYGGEQPRRKHVSNSYWMVKLVALLIRSCETDSLPKLGPSPSQSSRILISLLPVDHDLMLMGWSLPIPAVEAGSPPFRAFLPWLLSDRGAGGESLTSILVHWCWEHLNSSCRVIDMLLKLTVNELTTVAELADYRPYFECMIGVLAISDSLATQTERVAYGLSEIFILLGKLIVRNKIGDEKYLFTAMQHVIKLTHQSKVAAAWMKANPKKYAQLNNDEYSRNHSVIETTHNSNPNNAGSVTANGANRR